MFKGKLFVVASAFLLGAAVPSFGQNLKGLAAPEGFDLTMECESDIPEHQDEQFRFHKISPKWRAVIYGSGPEPSCSQMLLSFEHKDDTFVTDATAKIKPMTAAPSCANFVGKPAVTGLAGRMQTYCIVKDKKISRYVMMIIWDTEEPTVSLNQYGAIYSLQGGDQHNPADVTFRGVGVDPILQSINNMFLTVEMDQ
jgi:hypothetical protein